MTYEDLGSRAMPVVPRVITVESLGESSAVPLVAGAAGREGDGGRRKLRLLRVLAVRSLVVAVACSSLAAVSTGQTQVMTFTGPPGATIPNSYSPAGDLNGDNVPDVIAGTSQPVSRVFVFSGADGSIIHTISAPVQSAGFGKSVDGGVDVSRDGVPDILVGAYSDSPQSGHVYLYSGATYSLIREHVGVPGQNLGRPVAFLDDFDGDGTSEYGAGATHFGNAFREPEIGEAYVFSGATGSTLYSLIGETPGDLFGVAIASLGLIDEDEVPDFAVGADGFDAPGAFNCGAVYLYSGQSGDLIRKDTGASTNVHVGGSIAPLGDVDDDGKDDYVTAWFPQTNGALVLSGADGSVLTSMQGPPVTPFAPVGTIEDLDGDRKRDVLLSHKSVNGPGGFASAVGSLSGVEVFRIEDPLSQSLGFPGVSLSLDDLDGDGREEIGVADLFDDPLGGGSIYAYSVRPLHALTKEVSASSPGAVPFDVNAGVPYAGGTYFFLVSVTPLGAPGPCTYTSCGDTGPAIGPVPVHLPMCVDAVTPYGIFLMNQKPFFGMFGTLDAVTGKSEAPLFDITGVTLPPAVVCFSFYFAYVAKPANGGPWDLASNAEAVLIVP